MPEMVEVERYRQLASRVVGWRITGVDVVDAHVLRGLGAAQLCRALTGRAVTAARRRGKLLLLDTGPAPGGATGGPTLGLRFGMTGNLSLDGTRAFERVGYPPAAAAAGRWVRFRLLLGAPGAGRGTGHELVLHDPRRLGRVLLDPDEGALGPDVATLSPAELRGALAAGRGGSPLKVRLTDQAYLAGVGNLMADEALWRAGLSPLRPSASLSPVEQRRLLANLRRTVADLTVRGGSHTGDLMAERHLGGRCPRDGGPLCRTTLHGRTTWWCPGHQR